MQVIVAGKIIKRNGRVIESTVRADLFGSMLPWGRAEIQR